MNNIYLDNVFVPLFKIEEHFNGGFLALVSQLRFEYRTDDYLICIKVKNATEISQVLDILIEGGLLFDYEAEKSDDFCVLSKEGMWWSCAWLIHENENAWFIADVNAPVAQ